MKTHDIFLSSINMDQLNQFSVYPFAFCYTYLKLLSSVVYILNIVSRR